MSYTTNAIEVRNLNKQYKDFSLKNVSFTLPSGSIMGFIGENGAGKSTTISSLCGAVLPSGGEILLLGENPYENQKIKEDVAVVFDQLCLNSSINASDTEKIMKHSKRNFDSPLYFSYLKRFNLPLKKAIKAFSKGMAMKLSLAIALASKPKLIILDEATSGLDPVIREEILDILLEFIQDESHSVLISSHITSDLDKVADYITFIHDGKIIFSESRIDLNEKYGQINLSADTLSKINKSFIVKKRENQFASCALIKNKAEFKQKYSEIEVNSVSTEEIMLFYSRGNNI